MKVRVLQSDGEPTNWIENVVRLEVHNGELLVYVGDARKVTRFEGGTVLEAKDTNYPKPYM